MLYNNLQKGIYILHENPEWIPPFALAFERAGVEFGEIILTNGSIDIDKEPPKGVFWSRISASSHTRDNAFSKEYGRSILSWLESHNRAVINGSSVLELEVSKVRQYLALSQAGFRTPKTIAVFGKEDLLEQAKKLQTPFITKHNQGGKGLGVRRFDSLQDFSEYVESSEFETPIDGVTLLQEYVRSKELFITRVEFIGGRFHYAVRVDTSGGAFKLCPADACALEDAQNAESNKEILPQIAGAACDINSNSGGVSKFSLREDINENTPLVQQLEGFLKLHKIQVAGVEFIETQNGEIVVYDINTNTNYNKVVEDSLRAQGKQAASDRIVEFLREQLDKTNAKQTA
ncbi:ATP-grasp domain-containing protein [Helicobacter sp. T3_23-1056]